MKKDENSQPPRLIKQVFEWWTKRADTEDLVGDMEEYFQYNVEKKGKLKAQFIYFHQVFSLVCSYAIRKRKRSASYSNYYNTNSFAMFSNYFKIAIRNFSKHKFFTSINIVGLALGMSISLLVLSISVSIYRSDDFNGKKDRIHQINTYIAYNSKKDKTYASTFHAVGYYMKEKYPFVEHIVKIKDGFRPEFKRKGNKLNFLGHYADAAFFEVFEFPMIMGNPKTALSQPFSIVLTKSVADQLYPDENPLGKVLETEFESFTVTGVMKDLQQTHLYFEVLTSYQTFVELQPVVDLKSDWKNYRNNYVYVLLKPETTQNTLSESLAQISAKATEFNSDYTIELQSMDLSGVVPRWNISNALGIGWDQPSLIFFMSIGLLILLPAVFNYTNLSIARALKRAKEIGIRKVVGAEKGQIKAQFIIETILLSFMALIGSVFIFLPMQEEFLGMIKSSQSMDTSIGFILISAFILFTLLIGIFTGIFPAIYFSRLNPIHTMKGEIQNRSGGISQVKKGLFVFQFFLSLVFIIGVGTITKEYAYVLNENHGFTSDNMLAVQFQDIDKQLVINELKNHPDVKSITTTSNLPGLPVPIMTEATSNDQDTLDVKQVFIGEDFVENFDMKVVWGESKNLDKSTQNEEFVVVNEAFMRSVAVFNLQQDSLTFTLMNGTKCRVIGILEDFNFEPLNQFIRPLVFRYSLEESNYALLTVNSENIQRTIEDLDAIWTSIDQKVPFEATFLDDEIEKAYWFFPIQIKFFSFLSAFAISISCLGLLGMVSYTTENRTKEIAIRKIMGATNKSLYYLLTKDFIKLIAISSAIAIPFSYFFYDKLFLFLLLKYANGMGVIEVLLSVIFLFLVGFVSIYWQTSKVAHANPSGNLRYE